MIGMMYKSCLLIGGMGISMVSATPVEEKKFFDGKSLVNWSAAKMHYWSVKDGVIIGESSQHVPKNQFLWSNIKVKDFYLALDVRLAPANRNAGIQFRSKPINKEGQAFGYQADVAATLWGTLYHEHGRGKLDWSSRGKKVEKANDWNRYEILAIGHNVWLAINGKITSAIYDPKGELQGQIALQIHSGPAQKVEYKIIKLVHNPEMKLEHQTENELRKSLKKNVVGALQPLMGARRLREASAEKFVLQKGETVVILGGGNAYQAQYHGWLESYLSSAYSGIMVKYRNMAWPADTVFKQQRPRNFFADQKPNYGEKDGRPLMQVDKLFLWFGKLEALEGRSSIEKFKNDYTEMVAQAKGVASELILVTPTPYEDPLQLGIDVQRRNKNLQLYVDQIKKVAKEQQVRCVDLYTALGAKSITLDGIQLSPKGHRVVARELVKQLSGKVKEPTSHELKLRQEIIAKNRMWQNYWVPDNWAFLYGNRQTVPSSRLHTNPRVRWFPDEVRQWLVATEKKEQEIFQQRQ